MRQAWLGRACMHDTRQASERWEPITPYVSLWKCIWQLHPVACCKLLLADSLSTVVFIRTKTTGSRNSSKSRKLERQILRVNFVITVFNRWIIDGLFTCYLISQVHRNRKRVHDSRERTTMGFSLQRQAELRQATLPKQLWCVDRWKWNLYADIKHAIIRDFSQKIERAVPLWGEKEKFQ
jgi:hypothetical protein